MLHTFPFLAAILIMASAPAVAADEPLIGLITKTETNPFFVKMREGALQTAQVLGARLMTDAGRRDGDNAGQVTALENMIASGAKAILITPSDSKAIVPSIRKARAKGILVIALDSPTDPPDASDAVIATDNYRAGVLIGRYARSALAGKPLRIVMLDLFPGHPVGAQRHNGFLEGLGLTAPGGGGTELVRDPAVLCMADSHGDQSRAQTAMENCLARAPEVNLVYAINEPAAAGAHTALKRAGKNRQAILVAVDGGCAGIAAMARGELDATAQQYPLKMAQWGVEAAVRFAREGVKPESLLDTGVNLIAARAVPGVASQTVELGAEHCWGGK